MRAKYLPVLRPVPTDSAWGPKMSELNERERAFVWHTVCNGGNGRQAAIAAGYSDQGEAAKVRAHALRAKDSIRAAMHECAWGLLGSLAIPAVRSVGALIRNAVHPDHCKGVTAVLSRRAVGATVCV